jgi:hypothetical protein
VSAFDAQADLMRVLIASCSTFQTVTGLSTVALAKARVAEHQALDEEDEASPIVEYPRCIVADGGVIERRVMGTATWGGTGSLLLVFQFEAPSDKASTLAQREWFVGKVSAIMREAEVIAASRATPSGYDTSHLHIKAYRRTAGPYALPPRLVDQDAEDVPVRPLWEMEFEVEY